MKLFKNSCVRNIFVAAVAFGVAYGAQSLWAVCITGCSEGCDENPRWCLKIGGLTIGYKYLKAGVETNVARREVTQCVEVPKTGNPTKFDTFVREQYDNCTLDCELGVGAVNLYTTGAVTNKKAGTPPSLAVKTICATSSSSD